MRTLTLIILFCIFKTEILVNGFSVQESILFGISLIANESVRNSSKCNENLSNLYESAFKKELWALKAIDASGQPETGFLYGNNLWLGSHSHCRDISNEKPLEINHEKSKNRRFTPLDFPPFPMKFVKVYLNHNSTLQLHTHLPFDFTIQIGLCVPQVCSDKDLYELLQIFIRKKYLNVQQNYDLNLDLINVKSLEENSDFLFSKPKTIVLLSTVGIILLITSIQSCIEIVSYFKREKCDESSQKPDIKNGSKASKFTAFLKCFSLNENVKALVNTKLSSESIRCIHGVRFFGMLWVCTVHCVFYNADYMRDPPYTYRLSEVFLAQILSNSTYCVDTFLFLSGFLLAYIFYKSKRHNGKSVNYSAKCLEFLMMVFHRIFRLTPAYLICILLSDVLFTYLRQTSSLESSEAPDELCSKYFWRNLLYINNLYPRKEMCLTWSWYLALDTQAFTFSAILLIISSFSAIALKFIVFVIVCLTFSCMVSTALISYKIGYIPTMDEQLNHLDDIYDLPWNRMGPYFVGILTGLFLVKSLKFKLKIRTEVCAILWIIFPSINLWILFVLYGRQNSVEFSAVYMGVSRTLWGIGLAWLILACCTGNAGIINRFLSFPGWIPLSRITFCAYLLNPLVSSVMYLSSETPFTTSRAGFTINMMGTTFATFIYAFLFSMLFESPFVQLTKIMIAKDKQEKISTNERIVQKSNGVAANF